MTYNTASLTTVIKSISNWLDGVPVEEVNDDHLIIGYGLAAALNVQRLYRDHHLDHDELNDQAEYLLDLVSRRGLDAVECSQVTRLALGAMPHETMTTITSLTSNWRVAELAYNMSLGFWELCTNKSREEVLMDQVAGLRDYTNRFLAHHREDSAAQKPAARQPDAEQPDTEQSESKGPDAEWASGDRPASAGAVPFPRRGSRHDASVGFDAVLAVSNRAGELASAPLKHATETDPRIRARIQEAALEELAKGIASAVHPTDDVSRRLTTLCQVVFDWAVRHPRGFEISTGSRVTDGGDEPDQPTDHEAGLPEAPTGDIFTTLGPCFLDRFSRDFVNGDLVSWADDQVPAHLVETVLVYRETLGGVVSLGTAYQLWICWRRLYGVICMATHGHRTFSHNHEDVLDEVIDEVHQILGLESRPTPEHVRRSA
ncbi:WHG domain-containing protein [Nocardioides sp. NBC_00368]|uniref:hypothetical protein n=1 Tax=Nocardioides sp. NBC_00368 TaxID=2976000 RepID=UPI002E1E6448